MDVYLQLISVDCKEYSICKCPTRKSNLLLQEQKGEATEDKSVGPGIDSKRRRLEFILWQLTFPCALGSTQSLKMSTRIFLGVKAAGV